MKLKQVVAGAAIGCTLGVTGISLGSGIAGAAPPCSRLHRLNVAQAVRAGRRRSADPAGHRSAAPGGPPQPGGPGGPPG